MRIESAALNETRDVFVHLPKGYEEAEKRCPVLYVLDAEDVFTYAVGAVDFLSTARMPETIVVGIPNTNRERDIWVNLEDPNSGYVRFIQFLKKELIPAVDARYRTQPHRTLYGFCSGAGTVFWILFHKPEMFMGYIASGTGFDPTWAALAAQAFTRQPELKKSLFAVTEGTTPRAQGMPLLRNVLEKSAPPKLSWKCEVMESEEHGPVAAKGLFAGLEFIFTDWKPPLEVAAGGPEEIRAYYERLSRDYGFATGIPEQAVLSTAMSLLWQKGGKAASDTLQFIAQEYPDSPDALAVLGMALEDEKRFNPAEKAYAGAIANARKASDRRLPMFEEYLANLRKRMKEEPGAPSFPAAITNLE
ncbi:MAG: hypothetical protein JXO51_09415 [Candidatus Aminicenantes bacterium]|nr:hypothetical protein [Candidatus Aminicenantes bacterium]